MPWTSLLFLTCVFTTFVVGTACVGAAIVLARLRHDELARAFLWFYTPLTVLVLAALLLALMELETAGSLTMLSAFEYLEAFAGRYGVMLALPLFARRVVGMRRDRTDAVLCGIVLSTLAAQLLTEFVLGGSTWDTRGDSLEDVVFGGVFAYTLLITIRQLDQAVYVPLARRFLVLLIGAVPVVAFDVFFADGSGLRLYPLWYCALGVTMILTLVGRRAAAAETAPPAWGLTAREQQVLRLVQNGMSNHEIGRQLTISPNTVKTHLSAIFDKSGFRTRVALIAGMEHHPIG